MEREKLRVLVVDDSERVVQELSSFLEDSGCEVFSASTPSKGFELLEDAEPDILILDVRLPEMDGLSMLKLVRQRRPDVETIMITGYGDMEVVVEAMRAGAFDFFTKPFRLMDIRNAIERTKKFRELSKRLKEAQNPIERLSCQLEALTGHPLIYESRAMMDIDELMRKVAPADGATVLIVGESGVGKELVARCIHLLSGRKDGPFFAANCAAVPENLIENELFGHAKGAYTGAAEDKQGWFEAADGGTLFLDEIADMPVSLQAKLLRVLEDKTFRRVGGNRERSTDVRIISATNRNLERMIERKEFRTDLYHRLNTVTVKVPPLRERKEDILAIFHYYIKYYSKSMNKEFSGIDDDLAARLVAHPFPGNVRELKNMAERAAILSDGGPLHVGQLGVETECAEQCLFEIGGCPFRAARMEDVFDLSRLEGIAIRKALESVTYNKSQAAKLLGISWSALDRRMKKYGIEEGGT